MSTTLSKVRSKDGTPIASDSLPTERASSVTTPTLVIDGGASPAWMRKTAQALTDILPNARHRTLAGQEHNVAPEALAPVLVEFFAD